MTLAIGGSSVAGKPPHGTLWVDVRDYGAKADSGITDNSGPFQAAVDDLASRLATYQPSPKGVVFIPSATGFYHVSKTVWVDQDNIEIRGEGWGSMVIMDNYSKHSVFQFGLKRVERIFVNGAYAPLTVDATYRPDLFGKLDTSVVNAAGQMWGIRTNANSCVQFQASAMNAGISSAADKFTADNWGETSKLTVEFCVEPPTGQQFPLAAPLLGLGSILGNPSPFAMSIWDDPQKIIVMFRTSDIDANPNSPTRYFGFSLAGATAPYRIAVQLDLGNAVCSAFVNGVQVALTNQTNLSPTSSPPFVPNNGLTFATNEYAPFLIGANGPQPVGAGGQTAVDLRVYGLRLSNTIRYQNNSAGQAQTRIDSPATPINDAYAYFGKDANTICFLKGTDNPATSGRVVSVQHGPSATLDAITSGYIIHSVNPTPVMGNAVRDLQVVASNGFGQAISVANALEFTVENVKATGGYHGIGSIFSVANYNIYIRNCWLQGYDAAYFGVQQIIDARDVYCGTSGRVTLRHVGCSANWQNVFVAFANPNAECIFKGHSWGYGGNLAITNLFVDFEGQTLSKAAIYCEAVAYVPATSLVLKDIFLGTIGPNAALVMLKDFSNNDTVFHRCWVSIENLQAYTDTYLAAVDVDGPRWHGEMNGIALIGPQFNHRQKWGTSTNVVIRDTRYTAPPRIFSWYSGAHVLDVRSPVDGQFTEWRCVGSGGYGTASPPAWYGLNPLSVTQNGLASYLMNHAYITATLS